jgi:hypothetical protein
MPHDVQFDDVTQVISRFGSTAAVVTVVASLRPHVVSAVVGVDHDRLVIDVGPSTRANLTAHPGLALLWDPVGRGEYQLIVDGDADEIGEPDTHGVSRIRIRVVGGILHRLAGLPDGPPSCKKIADAAAE